MLKDKMGARANYVIRENGENELFYSHWGATTAAADVYWGPEPTEAFIRKTDPDDAWLDDVYAEGGIALNKDRKRVTYYSWHWPGEPDLERVYRQLLSKRWGDHGWTVHQAADWGELAESVGVAREAVTAPPTPPPLIELERLGQNLAKGSCFGLLSFRTNIEWADRAIDYALASVLMNGPSLLDRLHTIPDAACIAGLAPGNRPDEFAAIDVPARTLRVSLAPDERDRVRFVRDAWPGWTVICESTGAPGHFTATGRPVRDDLVRPPKVRTVDEPPNRDEAECLRLIEIHLAGVEREKVETHAWFKDFMTRMGGQSAPYADHQTPRSKPSFLDRLQTLAGKLRG